MNQLITNGFAVRRVHWDDPRAASLRATMSREMQARYTGLAADPEAVQQAISVDPDDVAVTIIVVADDGVTVGHAALRRLGDDWEVKRVMVDESRRGSGLGRLLMAEMETRARELGADRLILQTGDRQPDAVALYRRLGYTEIAIYQPYTDAVPHSICFEKVLAPAG